MATENQHKENSFTPVAVALELADYVFQITGNLKYDVEQRQSADNGYLPLQLSD